MSMEADFCVRVLDHAIARHVKPEIFDTDQGSQFTSMVFTERLKGEGIAISMGGHTRCPPRRTLRSLLPLPTTQSPMSALLRILGLQVASVQ